jgi:hypothetical protein
VNEAIDAAESLAQLPLVTLFALFIIVAATALWRDWIFTRGRVRDIRRGYDKQLEAAEHANAELQSDRNYWRSVALRALGAAESLVRRDDGG